MQRFISDYRIVLSMLYSTMFCWLSGKLTHANDVGAVSINAWKTCIVYTIDLNCFALLDCRTKAESRMSLCTYSEFESFVRSVSAQPDHLCSSWFFKIRKIQTLYSVLCHCLIGLARASAILRNVIYSIRNSVSRIFNVLFSLYFIYAINPNYSRTNAYMICGICIRVYRLHTCDVVIR